MNLSLAAIQPSAPGINFGILAPELILVVAGVVVMLVDAFTRRRAQRWVTGALSLVGLGASAVATLWLWGDSVTVAPTEPPWGGMVTLDPLRLSFTLVFIVVAALTVLVSMIWVEWEGLPAGEFHTLLLFATVGMMLMAAGNDLVMIFLGLEILSIATYVMAGFRKSDLRSNESSLKYFILGSFSSAFLLYGIALVYGATAHEITVPAQAAGESASRVIMAGTTNIGEIAERLNDGLYPPLLFAGAAMMLIGFGFKIATAPFHVWTPDVYEGAPTPVTAFMAAGPKAAGFAAFMRVFLFAFPFIAATSGAGDTGAKLHYAWLYGLSILAVLTMTIGNVVALVQDNVKRMLAYSSIAHAGYALVGFVAAGVAATDRQRDDAIASVIFYLLTYSVMNLGAFAVVTLVARSGDRRTDVEDYRGIGFRAPALSLTLSLFLLSLLGVPLTAGFMGKVVVFGAALDNYTEQHPWLIWLVVVGVLNTAISVYYYLRLIVVMFFRERTTEWGAPRIPASVALVLVITVAGVLYLGIFPGSVLDAFRATQAEAVTGLRR
ncbi:MAG TPA: NADH-quinone oxidoreductase subunit N [Pyrinomonadaceae bacterium]|nr:NADH-quinone oxidoreductase subunit N [Pyrinomonadaceae bacterium]